MEHTVVELSVYWPQSTVVSLGLFTVFVAFVVKVVLYIWEKIPIIN